MQFHSSPAFFFFNDTATTEIYTLSLHDALPIYIPANCCWRSDPTQAGDAAAVCGVDGSVVITVGDTVRDRKSTRLNSSHSQISYAVFCLKKKNNPCAPLLGAWG